LNLVISYDNLKYSENFSHSQPIKVLNSLLPCRVDTVGRLTASMYRTVDIILNLK
jgi:hypothetical protein